MTWKRRENWSEAYRSQERVRSRLEGMPTIGTSQELVMRSGKEPTPEQAAAFEAEVLAAAQTIRQSRGPDEVSRERTVR